MTRRGQAGQAFPLVLALTLAIVAAGAVIFAVGRAYAAKSDAQSAADLVAVGTARTMRRELVAMAGALTVDERRRWQARLSDLARRLARANGARLDRLQLIDGGVWPPTTVRVQVTTAGPMGTALPAAAQAQIQSSGGTLADLAGSAPGGEYHGPLVQRQGKPTCPAVAAAFDRMSAAARHAGVHLVITSAFRTDAEQAALYARHPDPKWVAPPGRSRHRNATELDLGGAGGAWIWLAANARSFGFAQRYSWEPWHYGYLPGCQAGVPTGEASATRAEPPGVLPAWVPAPYRATIIRAAADGGVPPLVLAALLRAESGFNPLAVSPVGAQGIAQFMPATARGMGLTNPFDPQASIAAAGRLLGGHVRAFGSIPLALAAYNAGPGAVRRYGGIPPYAETRAYVTKIMAIAGDPALGDRPVGGDDVLLTRIDGLLV